MSASSPDTAPKAAAVLIRGLRSMGGARRLGRVFELREATLSLAAARLREQYGVLPPRELQLRLASLWFDRETMQRVFGWPHDDGAERTP